MISPFDRLSVLGRRGSSGPNSALQAKFLFWGKYSEISGGQMPSKVTGATDYLTVSGSAGSETYQCPNTAPYISADTDYIWFKTDATQRTTTTAELIGYDLQRTPVKYLYDAPNSIQEIIILKAGEVLTADELKSLHHYMRLPILWSGYFVDEGYEKSNRPLSQQYLWTPEPVFPAILSDGNTVGFYEYDDLTTITKDGSNRISLWKDKLLSGRDLAQAGADNLKPIWGATEIAFDGVAQYLKTAAFTLNQPEEIFIVFNQVTWTIGKYIFDGNANNSGMLRKDGTTPQLKIYAGTISAANANLPINTYGIGRILFNGASSKFILDNTAPVTGNYGAVNMGGFTLGTSGNAAIPSRVNVKAVIIRKIADTAPNEIIIYNYLATKYGLPTI